MVLRSIAKRVLLGICAVAAVILMDGCNANAWMGDPAANGYYKPTPTTIPILDRIDIIEEQNPWPQVTKATPEDLTPSDLEYRIAAGDTLDVEIYGLYLQGQRYPVQRRVDQGGYFRVPEVGDVLIAGLTPQAAQEVITKALANKVLAHPSVQVSLANQTGFTYTVYGGLSRWGVFNLVDPDLRLIDVLALAGGVPQSTKKIHVIRQLPVSDSMLPSWDRGKKGMGKPNSSLTMTKTQSDNNSPTTPSIEDLIKQLDSVNSQEPVKAPSEIPSKGANPDKDIQDLINQLDIGNNTNPSVSPGILQTDNQVPIDIDDLVGPSPKQNRPIDVDDLTEVSVPTDTSGATFIYVPESDSWVKVSTNPNKQAQDSQDSEDGSKKQVHKVLERIIAIPWDKLRQGDSSYNIVIRPDDRIYVEPPPLGNLYIRGEVARPGVFGYPTSGEKMTLSEFITAAGDLGPIAVPERVSLTRRIGENMQATVTLNYAAILQRTEPDIFLKPNDLISIGTSWGATPMAIIRNGFRATYGFGFLLDRNFGNDVFGRAP